MTADESLLGPCPGCGRAIAIAFRFDSRDLGPFAWPCGCRLPAPPADAADE